MVVEKKWEMRSRNEWRRSGNGRDTLVNRYARRFYLVLSIAPHICTYAVRMAGDSIRATCNVHGIRTCEAMAVARVRIIRKMRCDTYGSIFYVPLLFTTILKWLCIFSLFKYHSHLVFFSSSMFDASSVSLPWPCTTDIQTCRRSSLGVCVYVCVLIEWRHLYNEAHNLLGNETAENSARAGEGRPQRKKGRERRREGERELIKRGKQRIRQRICRAFDDDNNMVVYYFFFTSRLSFAHSTIELTKQTHDFTLVSNWMPDLVGFSAPRKHLHRNVCVNWWAHRFDFYSEWIPTELFSSHGLFTSFFSFFLGFTNSFALWSEWCLRFNNSSRSDLSPNKRIIWMPLTSISTVEHTVQ